VLWEVEDQDQERNAEDLSMLATQRVGKMASGLQLSSDGSSMLMHSPMTRKLRC